MRYLGLDLGTKTLGVAISDKTNSIASFLKVIRFDFEDYDSALKELEEVTANAEGMAEGADQGHYYHDVVFTAMDALRAPADKLEMLVAKEAWPFPSYGDLIFEV